MTQVSIFWFRRDLRLEDNVGLCQALSSDHPVQPIFIFDQNILSKLEDKRDARVHFIHTQLQGLNEKLTTHGGQLDVRVGDPMEIWQQLLKDYQIEEVFANRDYEPYALRRDKEVYDLLAENGIRFRGFKDQVIFEKSEVTKDDGKPYTVYTPYSKKWKSFLREEHLQSHPSEELKFWYSNTGLNLPSLQDIGFEESPIQIPKKVIGKDKIRDYHKTRDIPSFFGTSRLGVHLRFGTISIRTLATLARATNEKFFNELIWREFYQMILYHFPHVVEGNFKKSYDLVKWRTDEADFHKWCEGKTGFPIVDAGMRELNETGYMHNRVRMITASFLCKDLLIDWKWGEAYFAKKLLDFDLASNNGGWQWAAGTGVDAAPYFRIFNPTSQQAKFDPDFKYIKKWVPEFGTDAYPRPMVDHKLARERTLSAYKDALN